VQDRANTYAAPRCLGAAGLSGERSSQDWNWANAIVLDVDLGREHAETLILWS
jgi:hypothetical protein